MYNRTVIALMISGALSLTALPAVAQQTTNQPADQTVSQPVTAQTSRNDGFDWGWLGLLGLVGLAGLAGRNRDRATTTSGVRAH